MDKKDKINEEEFEGKSNVAVLTIIAIVTMVVVVIGATFAYFAGSIDNDGNALIQATANGAADMFIINAGDNLVINADMTNFDESQRDSGNLFLEASTESSISFTSSDTTSSYSYTMKIVTNNNDFDYSSGKCYNPDDTLLNDITTEVACTQAADSAGADQGQYYVWAKNSLKAEGVASTYGCYSHPVEVTGATDEYRCMMNTENIWDVDTKRPELVLYLYKEITQDDVNADVSQHVYNNQTDCTAVGKCFSTATTSPNGSTSQNCELNGDDWISNVWENDRCYQPINGKDLTRAADGSVVYLNDMDNGTVIALDGASSKVHNYKATLRFINKEHSQMLNAKASYSGRLEFNRIQEEPLS